MGAATGGGAHIQELKNGRVDRRRVRFHAGQRNTIRNVVIVFCGSLHMHFGAAHTLAASEQVVDAVACRGSAMDSSSRTY